MLTIGVEQGDTIIICDRMRPRRGNSRSRSRTACRIVAEHRSSDRVVRLLRSVHSITNYVHIWLRYIVINSWYELCSNIARIKTNLISFGYIAFRVAEVCSFVIYVQCIKRCYLFYSQYCVVWNVQFPARCFPLKLGEFALGYSSSFWLECLYSLECFCTRLSVVLIALSS